jgi:hypothetical protein
MRVATAAIGVVGLALATGCAGTSGTWTLSVRDASDEQPVPDAHVHARAIHEYMPNTSTSVHDIPVLNWGMRGPDDAITDADGTAQIRAPIDRPFELVVYVPFEAPRGVTVDPTTRPPSILEGWIALSAPDDPESVYEVRLEPARRR